MRFEWLSRLSGVHQRSEKLSLSIAGRVPVIVRLSGELSDELLLGELLDELLGVSWSTKSVKRPASFSQYNYRIHWERTLHVAF